MTVISGMLLDVSACHQQDDARQQQNEALLVSNQDLERSNRAMVGREPHYAEHAH